METPYITTKGEEELLHRPTVKSYKNGAFLLSHEARMVRIMCEFEEPKCRLKQEMVRSTVLFFGSARAKTRKQFLDTKSEFEKQLKEAKTNEAKEAATDALDHLSKTEWMCEWMDKVQKLAKMVTEFAQKNSALIQKSFEKNPDYFSHDVKNENQSFNDFIVTTGGGPGFMEAANAGAASVPGGKSMGMAISLPFEKGVNRYVSEGLAFEFHYFFSRKFWMMYSCRAIVVAPGGVGTLDEAFELLTLRQTGKIPNLPVVFYCTRFWKSVINWQQLVEFGVIAQRDIDGMLITDDCDEALAYIEQFYKSL